MVISDRIYGSFKIESPAIEALIASSPLQRLKNISQVGIPPEYYFMKSDNRFQHSIGVMLLLKILGASEEEQVAGLLHDISHTAFSHVIDWIAGDPLSEDYQDKHHGSVMHSREISGILQKFGYDVDKISRHTSYSLLDRDIPELCADRIDYALREFPEKTARELWKNLTVAGNRIAFESRSAAGTFALNFLKRQRAHWGGFEAVTRYHYFSLVLKTALAEGLIVFSDFMKDEPYILARLEKLKDKRALHILEVLRKKSLAGFPRTKNKLFKKFRYVDPMFLESGNTVLLSKAFSPFSELVEKEKAANARGISIAVI